MNLTELVDELRGAAADRQHLGTNADRFTRAADALEELTREMHARELHHFESEKAMEEALAVLSAASLPQGMTEAQFNVSLMSKARRVLREATA